MKAHIIEKKLLLSTEEVGNSLFIAYLTLSAWIYFNDVIKRLFDSSIWRHLQKPLKWLIILRGLMYFEGVTKMLIYNRFCLKNEFCGGFSLWYLLQSGDMYTQGSHCTKQNYSRIGLFSHNKTQNDTHP